MYVKVQMREHQWFRDDNGTLVGQTANTYANKYYGGKTPIIKRLNGVFVKPIYGRIDPKTNAFVPLCEGMNTKLCVGTFCKGSCENIFICPRYNQSSLDGYYIWID